MAILKIEACVSCGTPASTTIVGAAYVAQIARKKGMHECTSFAGEVEGGGPCCQLLAHEVVEELNQYPMGACVFCGEAEVSCRCN